MKKVVMANWKMNKTGEQTRAFFEEFAKKAVGKDNDIVFCVPFTALRTAGEYSDKLGFTLGAQNFHPAKNGAFTGEVSVEMLKEVSVKVVLCGHSERRAIFNETDEFVNEKVRSALAGGLYVCICIGETLSQREAGETEAVLKTQLKKSLAGVYLSKSDFYTLAVAYEPVWAIGTGVVATLEQIEAAHKFIKSELNKMYSSVLIPILYGGSVNEKNAPEIMAIKNVNGVLVGGASLDPEKFAQIAKN